VSDDVELSTRAIAQVNLIVMEPVHFRQRATAKGECIKERNNSIKAIAHVVLLVNQ
jgi:hypothetical protein